MASAALTRLKADGNTLETVLKLIKYHDPVIPTDEKSVKRWLNKLTPDLLFMLLELKAADNKAQVADPRRSEGVRKRLADYDLIRTEAERIMKDDACFSLKQLAVNGNDLAAIGIPRSKEMGRVLSIILEAVISGEVANEKEDIFEYLKNYIF